MSGMSKMLIDSGDHSNIEFATLQTAKRHKDMQEKSYPCEYW